MTDCFLDAKIVIGVDDIYEISIRHIKSITWRRILKSGAYKYNSPFFYLKNKQSFELPAGSSPEIRFILTSLPAKPHACAPKLCPMLLYFLIEIS